MKHHGQIYLSKQQEQQPIEEIGITMCVFSW